MVRKAQSGPGAGRTASSGGFSKHEVLMEIHAVVVVMKVYISGLTFPVSGTASPDLLQNEAPRLILKTEEFCIDKHWGKKQRRALGSLKGLSLKLKAVLEEAVSLYLAQHKTSCQPYLFS